MQEPRVALTYAQLHQTSRALAAFLHAAGARPTQRLGVLSANHWQLMPLHFATAALRCVLLNLNTRLSAQELAHKTRQRLAKSGGAQGAARSVGGLGSGFLLNGASGGVEGSYS